MVSAKTSSKLPSHHSAAWLGPPSFYQSIPEDQLPLINRMPTCSGITITFQVIAWLAVIFRIYCRTRLVRSFGWDDTVVILALLATTVSTITLVLEPVELFGQHFGVSYVIAPSLTEAFLRFHFLNSITYMAATALIKLAILLQYLRLYSETSQRLPRLTCYVLSAMVVLWGLAFFFIRLFGCHPVSAVWSLGAYRPCWGLNSSDPDELYAGYLAHAVINMVFDYMVLCIPIVFYRHLQFGRDHNGKVGLASLFVIGTCVATTSAIRLAYIVTTKAATAPTFDLSWNSPVIMVLSALEVECAVICASVPIFWPTLISSMRILVVNEVVVSSEERKPPSSAGWMRHSDSSDLELRKLAAGAGVVEDGSGRVYGKDTYITGWEVDDVDRRGNHAVAMRADKVPAVQLPTTSKGDTQTYFHDPSSRFRR